MGNHQKLPGVRKETAYQWGLLGRGIDGLLSAAGIAAGKASLIRHETPEDSGSELGRHSTAMTEAEQFSANIIGSFG